MQRDRENPGPAPESVGPPRFPSPRAAGASAQSQNEVGVRQFGHVLGHLHGALAPGMTICAGPSGDREAHRLAAELLRGEGEPLGGYLAAAQREIEDAHQLARGARAQRRAGASGTPDLRPALALERVAGEREHVAGAFTWSAQI